MERERSSLLKPLKNGPEWIAGLTANHGSKTKKKEVRNCPICTASLSKFDKRVCKCCGQVTCRLCIALVHLMDYRRRKHVCFRCLKPATEKVPGDSSQPGLLTNLVEQHEQHRESVEMGNPVSPEEEQTFFNRVWGLWSSWMDQDGTEADSEDDSEDEEEREAKRNTIPSAEVKRASRKIIQEVEEGSGIFDGYKMAQLLTDALAKDKTVKANLFLEACTQVVRFTSALGQAFSYVNVELNLKIDIMHRRVKEYADETGVPMDQVTLQQLVEKDIKNKFTHAGKKKAPASRTMLRLLWFIDFIRHLLRALGEQPNAPLKSVCSKVYDTSLAPHHSFMIKKMVKVGLSGVPSRDVFRQKMNLADKTVDEECKALIEWAGPADHVAAELWAYMEGKGLKKLP